MKPPKELTCNARQKWKEIIKQLGSIEPSEVDALMLLVNSWDIYLTAYKHVQQNGTIITGSDNHNGRSFINPNVNVMNEAWKQIVKLSNQLGVWETRDTGEDEWETPE